MTDTERSLSLAGRLAEDIWATSDLLTGAVTTLINEGWSEAHARRIVVHLFTQAGLK